MTTKVLAFAGQLVFDSPKFSSQLSRSPRAMSVIVAAESRSRSRSRSPPVDVAEVAARAEVAPALATVAAAPAVALAARPRTSRLPSHVTMDFSTWDLVPGPRNSYGSLAWNLRTPERGGDRFNFHDIGGEGRAADAWSTITYELSDKNQEGKPDNKLKIWFEINDGQQQTIERLEGALIDLIFAKSAEVLNQKTAVAKREMIEQQFYQSMMKVKTEQWPSKVRMNFIIRGDPKRWSTMYYFKLQEDGQTYEKQPIVARGWDEIEPLMGSHKFRGAKIRALEVRCWALSVANKKIYPTIEIAELYVREPKPNSSSSRHDATEEELDIMYNLA